MTSIHTYVQHMQNAFCSLCYTSDPITSGVRNMRCIRAFRLIRCHYDINLVGYAVAFCCFPSCTLLLYRSYFLFITNILDPLTCSSSSTLPIAQLNRPHTSSDFHNHSPTTASNPIFVLARAMAPLYPTSVLLCEYPINKEVRRYKRSNRRQIHTQESVDYKRG